MWCIRYSNYKLINLAKEKINHRRMLQISLIIKFKLASNKITSKLRNGTIISPVSVYCSKLFRFPGVRNVSIGFLSIAQIIDVFNCVKFIRL